jgi:S1-C subfamily serine protease/flagellar basal body-associated protein FliL
MKSKRVNQHASEISTPTEVEPQNTSVGTTKPKQLAHHWNTHPHHKKLKFLAITGSILLLVLVVLLIIYFFIYKPRVTNSAATKQAIDILNEQTTTRKNRTITSGMGFAVTYDTNKYNGGGFVSNTAETRPGWVSGEEYTDKDLDVKRNYTIVTIASKAGIDASATHVHPDLKITTNFHKNFFDRNQIDKKYTSMSDLDVLLDLQKNKITDDGGTVRSAKKITVNGQEYYKVVAEKKITRFDVTTSMYNYFYITVNDGSPYWMSIYSVYDDVQGDVPALESIISTITYSKHDDSSLVRADGMLVPAGATLATTTSANATDNTTIQQGTIDSADAVRIVARNQVATVRIGVIRCGDVTYRAENGTSLTLKDTCTGEMGSGSIVTDDGYIITNGHVVTIPDDRLYQGYFLKADANGWKAYYDFVVNAGYVTRAEIQSYYDKAKSGDKQAASDLMGILTKVPAANISVANSEIKIDVETSDTPFELNTSGTRWSWDAAAGNITSAKLIDSEVDLSTGAYSRTSTATDVALIKVDGSFPTVTLSNLDGVNEDDAVTTMGFPGASDDKQTTKTLPTVSQGTVTQKGVDGGNHMMIAISAQIAAGNSGGPAFDAQGKQIGINTYGGDACPGETSGNNCFGSGIARDANDALVMMKKHNVSPNSNGTISQLWNDGIDAFLAGNYAEAADKFDQVNKKYPNNYLVAKFLALSKEQVSQGNAGKVTPATTTSDATSTILIVSLIIVAVLILGILTTLIIVLARRPKHGVTPGSQQPYYPQQVVPNQQPAQQMQYYQPPQPSQQSYYPPQTPQQQYYSPPQQGYVAPQQPYYPPQTPPQQEIPQEPTQTPPVPPVTPSS